MLRGKVWLLFITAPAALFPGMFSFRPSAGRATVRPTMMQCVKTLNL